MEFHENGSVRVLFFHNFIKFEIWKFVSLHNWNGAGIGSFWYRSWGIINYSCSYVFQSQNRESTGEVNGACLGIQGEPTLSLINNQYYVESTENMNWFEAQQFCVLANMELLSLTLKGDEEVFLEAMSTVQQSSGN